MSWSLLPCMFLKLIQKLSAFAKSWRFNSKPGTWPDPRGFSSSWRLSGGSNPGSWNMSWWPKRFSLFTSLRFASRWQLHLSTAVKNASLLNPDSRVGGPWNGNISRLAFLYYGVLVISSVITKAFWHLIYSIGFFPGPFLFGRKKIFNRQLL